MGAAGLELQGGLVVLWHVMRMRQGVQNHCISFCYALTCLYTSQMLQHFLCPGRLEAAPPSVQSHPGA